MKKFISLIIALYMVMTILPVMIMSVNAAETWLWPIENYYNISSGYGHRTWNNSWHSGIDIDSIGQGNILGKPVRAAKSGYATVYHNNASAGNYISINHGDGYVSRYLHLDSIAITNGNVTRGQIIGYAGNTGNSTGPHLHFDIKNNGSEVNPMPVNYDNRHTYTGSSAAFSENIRYDYDNISGGGIITNTNQVLRYGDKNESVRQLQTALNKVMNAGLAIDGEYGQATHDAVKAFQEKYGLAVDGDAGPSTLNKLNQLAGSHTTHSFITENESAHPHKEYKKCTVCGYTEYTGNTKTVSTCGTCAKPGKPSLENMWESYLTDVNKTTATINFSWLSTTNTTHYNLYTHKKNSNGEYESYNVTHYAENGMSLDLPIGEYRVQLQSTNSNASWVYTDSDWYYFEINQNAISYFEYPFENHIYVLSDSAADWHTAKAACEELGGHLATITSEAEYNHIVSMIESMPKANCYYVGGTDENSEGNWVWVTGEEWSYNGFWASGEPNNSGKGEHYMILNKKANDVPITSKYGFICEIENRCGENLIWELDDEGTLTISGAGAMYDYGILESAPWIEYQEDIKKLVIEEGVTSIGDWAFDSCYNVISIELPDGLERIGRYAFWLCESVKNVILPDSIVEIDDNAFGFCESLISIEIPKNVESIGMRAFYECRKMNGIVVYEDNEYYSSDGKSLFNKSKTEIIQYAIGNSNTYYKIPEGVKVIGADAFYNCRNLTEVEIPTGVIDIKSNAFAYCTNISTIKVPEGLTNIGDYAFTHCFNLKSVDFPNSLECVGAGIFSDCGALSDIYFYGKEEQWDTITFGESNENIIEDIVRFIVPAEIKDILINDLSVYGIELYSIELIAENVHSDAQVLFASYDENGVLIDIRKLSVGSLKTNLPKNKVRTIKAFIWDNFNKPMCEPCVKEL